MLDNPVWHALTTQHAHLAITAAGAARYSPAVAPFGAVERATARAADQLTSLLTAADSIYLVGVAPPEPHGWILGRRLTRVALRGGLTGNAPGDSVSVLGVTSSRAGQPTLDLSVISMFGARPEPIPLAVGTGPAASASNGAWDAALAQITGALISDTATVAPDFLVVVSDGSGSLEMILDGNLPFPRTAFRPGRSLNARGVLVPNGVGGWVFKPRGLGDVVIN